MGQDSFESLFLHWISMEKLLFPNYQTFAPNVELNPIVKYLGGEKVDDQKVDLQMMSFLTNHSW